MSLNSSAAQPPLSPQQQDTGLPVTPTPVTSAVANPSEPVLATRSATNASAELAVELNQPPTPIAQNSAPKKSDRSTSTSSAAKSATTGDELTALYEAAWSGDAESQFRLGEYYYRGQDLEINKKRAFIWFQEAAEKGNLKAQFNVGTMYRDGVGVEKSEEKAFECFHKAAAQGNLKAQVIVGAMYSNGKGVEIDKEKAFMWYHKAAVQGHSVALFNLGILYRTGKGVEVDKEKAFESFHKAAEQGASKAQFNVGLMYSDGEGVEKQEEKAFEWFCKAAEQGSDNAQQRVIECYQTGIGVAKDLPLAAYWLLKFLVLTSYTSIVINLDHHYELIKLFPGIFEKYSEFKDINTINFYSDRDFFWDEEIPTIMGFIRSNCKVTDLKIDYPALDTSNVHFSAVAEALKFNTQLTMLTFTGLKKSKEISDQIEVLLTQNRDIAELRQYVKDLRIEKTPGFPFDAVKIMADKTIVAYLKSGQTKEATKKAIDELLIIAGIKALEEDSKIT
jgi:TPR repeat protein